MSARTVARLADEMADSIRSFETLVVARIPQARAYFDAYAAAALSADPVAPFTAAGISPETLQKLSRDSIIHMQFTAQDVAHRRLWERTRIVYDVDPDALAAIADTENGTIPADLLGRLPHPNPFVALPEPVDLPMDDGGIQRVVGFFVCGAAPGMLGAIQRSSDRPGNRALRMMFCGRVLTADGTQARAANGDRDMVWTRVTLDPAEGDLDAMIAASMSAFVSAPGTHADWRSDVPTLMRMAASLVVYLCTDNADTVEVRPAARRTGRKAQKARTRTVQVGFRVGTALRAHRRRTAGPTSSPGTGRVMPPHVRRAHLAKYYTGPRAVPLADRPWVFHWIPPLPINMTGPADTTTVIPA